MTEWVHLYLMAWTLALGSPLVLAGLPLLRNFHTTQAHVARQHPNGAQATVVSLLSALLSRTRTLKTTSNHLNNHKSFQPRVSHSSPLPKAVRMARARHSHPSLTTLVLTSTLATPDLLARHLLQLTDTLVTSLISLRSRVATASGPQSQVMTERYVFASLTDIFLTLEHFLCMHIHHQRTNGEGKDTHAYLDTLAFLKGYKMGE